MSDLHDLTALEQGAAVARGDVSSLELVEHHLERAARLSDELGAFVTLTDDAARETARRLDATPLTQRPTGPLVGVPTAIKDLAMTAGVETTFGSAAMAGHVPDVSDEVVLAIEAGGLVSLGKTATPEFGSPCYTEPEGQPPAVTPWDTSRMAGGSSGGAASAVAGGLVPLAHGSDGGGSIRIPASCCGLVGLKPSRGRISGGPMLGDVVGLGVNGPLAHTVRDAAAMLDVMAGPRVGDPFWAPEPMPGDTFLAACDRPPGRLRVARTAVPAIADAPVDPECLAAYDRAGELLEQLGHDVEDVTLDIDHDAVPVFETCWSVGAALATVPEGKEVLLRPLTRWLADRGRAVSGPEFALAVGELRRIAARLLTGLAPYDLVLTPTLAQPPLPVGALRDDDDPARDFENQKRFTPWTALWNITGMPAVSLPLHVTPSGLPVGVMLAARPAAEELLLSVAAQVERAAPWQERRPPCW